MKQSNFLYILRLVLTLFVITAAVAGGLAGVNAITKDRIAAAKAEKTQKAILEVLPDGAAAAEIAFTDESGLVTAVYASVSGYAVKVAPNGFGGAIEMMVGISKDGKCLGISIISHAETPSLGAVAAADSAAGKAFREQFIDYDGILDAISGATITSTAIETGVNAAIQCVKEGL